MKKLVHVEAVSPVIKRTYVDANLLIAAWHGKGDAGFKALEILDEFVSGEKPGKPMFRVTEIPVRSLRGSSV